MSTPKEGFFSRFKYFFVTIIVSLIVLITCNRKTDISNLEPKSREQRITEQFDSWDGSLYSLENLIKKGMHDPSSYEHIETRYADKKDYILVSTSFRGKNAFGALVKNTVSAKVDINGKVIEILK
ncbi:MAG: hypothetical protein JEZ01_08335 [Labilibaculum sp.]|nr:hypothetical protein [Labilibaculum sp.]MBI9057769.1 hypothetical protein [Labilibaculum sp.]